MEDEKLRNKMKGSKIGERQRIKGNGQKMERGRGAKWMINMGDEIKMKKYNITRVYEAMKK